MPRVRRTDVFAWLGAEIIKIEAPDSHMSGHGAAGRFLGESSLVSRSKCRDHCIDRVTYIWSFVMAQARRRRSGTTGTGRTRSGTAGTTRARPGSAGTNRTRSGAAGTGRTRPPSGGLHTQREDNPWEISIPDHPQRTDSPTYVISRKLMNDIVKEVKDFYLGTETPYQDHHGGGLWVKDDAGWLFIKNLAGMEWSQQFCADPAKVDRLRQFAQRIYKAFPQSIPALKTLVEGQNYPLEQILDEKIETQAQVARWVDSIFNASVPLSARRHTGVIDPKGGKAAAPTVEGGVHHYPTPITDIQLFKHDDFQLWVVDSQGALAAVTPAHPRGSGRSEVNVAYATPGTPLQKRWVAAHQKGEHLQLSGSHPMAKQAFAAQH